jgi:hypothetical protein
MISSAAQEVTMEKSIIIIRGGITGLSVGCHEQMNGYQTRIFEMHDKTGGVCTGWKRKGYTINGCMHWLVGTSPANSFCYIWEELGVARGWNIIDHELFMRIEGEGGENSKSEIPNPKQAQNSNLKCSKPQS